jgi:hypothetical protein
MNFSKQQLISEKNATGILSNYKDSTDPKYIGPGVWNTIHKQAYLAQTPVRQQQFIIFMKDTCYRFPCKVCRGHCTEYIKNNPLENYLGSTVDGKPLGLFVWAWKFHNTVNARLNKPIMSWDSAITLYSESDDKVCSLSCLEADDINEKVITNYTPLNKILKNY